MGGHNTTHEVLVGQFSMDCLDQAARGAVFIFEHRADRRIEQLAVAAVQACQSITASRALTSGPLQS
jgi:hypothetical protein